MFCTFCEVFLPADASVCDVGIPVGDERQQSRLFETIKSFFQEFRIGTGALLFLTAVSLVRGDSIRVPSGDSVQSLAVVPMAIPITLGPASIGVLMVYGGEIKTGLGFFLAYLSISAAVICVGALLLVSNYIQKAIGKNGLVVLSKLTGLILAALSAQMIFEGADAFLLQTLEKLK